MPEGPEIRRAAELKAAGAPRSAYRFWVYGRAGKPCRVCGQRLTAETVGGRKCFWWPSCQDAGARRKKSSV